MQDTCYIFNAIFQMDGDESTPDGGVSPAVLESIVSYLTKEESALLQSALDKISRNAEELASKL